MSTLNKLNFEYLSEFYNLSKIIYKLGIDTVDVESLWVLTLNWLT